MAIQAGWVGKGKDGGSTARSAGLAHQSQPLSSLRDPTSFGPPPRHVATTGESPISDYHPASIPEQQYEEPVYSESSLSSTRPPPVPQRPSGNSSPAQSSTSSIPLRTNTLGSNNSHVPELPARRSGAASPSLPPRSPTSHSSTSVPNPQPRARPNLPPRLPPRQNSNPLTSAPSPPPTYDQALQQSSRSIASRNDGLDQGAINRLGQAGVSVPGLNIGGGGTDIPSYSSSEAIVSAQSPSSRPQSPGMQSQVSELQQRFARMGKNKETSAEDSPTPVSATAAKKAPPPPPKKKPSLAGSGRTEETGRTPPPPPIPLGSKPSMG